MPNNDYALAMAAKQQIIVRAKPTMKDSEIERLFISDIVRRPGAVQPQQ